MPARTVAATDMQGAAVCADLPSNARTCMRALLPSHDNDDARGDGALRRLGVCRVWVRELQQPRCGAERDRDDERPRALRQATQGPAQTQPRQPERGPRRTLLAIAPLQVGGGEGRCAHRAHRAMRCEQLHPAPDCKPSTALPLQRQHEAVPRRLAHQQVQPPPVSQMPKETSVRPAPSAAPTSQLMRERAPWAAGDYAYRPPRCGAIRRKTKPATCCHSPPPNHMSLNSQSKKAGFKFQRTSNDVKNGPRLFAVYGAQFPDLAGASSQQAGAI